MKSPEKIVQHITQWLSQYLLNAKMEGFVVGVSGGIDSAVTSTLCALTAKPVLCLEMPIRQDPSQVSRALEHIAWLEAKFPNVRHRSVPLTPVFDAFESLTQTGEENENRLLSLANTRARLRMTTLYYYAALHCYIVAGTGNKVEDFGVGFYTKYGDGGVDLSPIADLMKTEVFKLAKHLSIIESIQQAAPSDGLWGDERTDEQQLGATYAELEWAMVAYEQKVDPSTFSEAQKKVFNRFKTLHLQNRHKMDPIPICKIPSDML